MVPHQSTEMLQLVNQVDNYPEFLQWCKRGFIQQRFEGGYEAGMVIRIKGIQIEFVTRNEIIHHDDHISMPMTLVSGPFRKLSGQWRFHQYPSMGSKVELQLQYEIRSQLLGRMFAKGFDQIAGGLVNDFVQRAGEVYAKD